ncbi:MAG: phasin family protein [Myxococcota bacterium]|jgi:predicted  nucleic acid-binding Zn-ribbon protein|nr:phasin family protein [Myxococcota bacterium]
MATRTAKKSTLDNTIDEIQTRFKKAGKELEKMQKRAEKNRRAFRTRTEKRVKKAQKELRKISVVKSAEDFTNDMRKQIDKGVDDVMSRMPLASNNEVKKLERKVNSLTRKVRALEKAAAPN